MISIDCKKVDINYFPDKTLLLKEIVNVKDKNADIVIKWNYENNEELLAIYFLTKHIKTLGYRNIVLDMPYIPNARQDRVKNEEDVFTLKYFAELINSLEFKEIHVLDAHSNVSLALLDRVKQTTPQKYIGKVIRQIEEKTDKKLLMFYPDEGACKRYSEMVNLPYCFGIKNRDWKTGNITNLSIFGELSLIEGSNVLIVDDICSFGGTFLYAARELIKYGAKNIYLFVSHCEQSILDGELYKSKQLTHIFTTDSIFFQKDNPYITVLPLDE